MQFPQIIKNNKLAFGGGGVVLLGVLGWLAFGFFGIHTAFIDDVVDEDGPVFTVTADSTSETAASGDDEMAESDDDMTDDDMADDEMADDEMADDEMADDDMAESDDEMAESEMTESEETVGEVRTIYDGDFTSLSRYTVIGDAFVLNNGTEQRFLRFENFDSSNGPDLKVYLRAENGDFVSLGELTGNIGDQNYEIPVDVDLDVFNTVEIWCERFSVGFGEALLSAV
ncbi:MAG: DM13 domain-containing protein [Actinomycetota bacterium]